MLIEYPDIKIAFNLDQRLRDIYNTKTSTQVAYTKLVPQHKKLERTEFITFNAIANTATFNYKLILNYFINRSTNASTEAFNAKIKVFRAQFKGGKNVVECFSFRLTTIFA